MSGTRVVYFEIDNIQKSVDFGTYALMMYYAKQLNPVRAKKLFDSTLSEWKYRIENNLSTGNLDGLKDLEPHFLSANLFEAIAFIEDELVPLLDNETQDLIKKYGGRENFVSLFYTTPDYLIALGVNEDEFYFDDPNAIKCTFQDIKEVLEYALSVNRPYVVYTY